MQAGRDDPARGDPEVRRVASSPLAISIAARYRRAIDCLFPVFAERFVLVLHGMGGWQQENTSITRIHTHIHMYKHGHTHGKGRSSKLKISIHYSLSRRG